MLEKNGEEGAARGERKEAAAAELIVDSSDGTGVLVPLLLSP